MLLRFATGVMPRDAEVARATAELRDMGAKRQVCPMKGPNRTKVTINCIEADRAAVSPRKYLSKSIQRTLLQVI